MFAWIARRKLARRRHQLDQRYRALLAEARDLQRKGDIRGFAAKTAEAEAVAAQLDQHSAAGTDARAAD
ncbi:MAG: Lacal_2735 family protein [Planctomycetes bacterium]|nr:Lacal_2735 family protein [Planctomycetota bacterium]